MKLGIVGTGVGIRTHLANALSNPEIKVVGVVGRSIERSQELLNKEGFHADLACNWSELLSQQPDIICITTALENRYEYINSLDSYSGVLLIEKPLIGDIGIYTLNTLLSNLKKRIYVDFQLRGLETIEGLRTRIRDGNFGTVYSITLFERTSALRRDKLANWMYSTETGGGQRFAMGSHLVDLAMFISGHDYNDVDLKNVSGEAQAPRASWKKNSPANANIDEVFRCDFSVVKCHVHISTTSISQGERTLEFRVEGTEGAAEFQYKAGIGQLIEWTNSGETISFVGPDGINLQEPPEQPLNNSAFRVAYPRYLDYLVRTIQGENKGVLATFEDGLINAEILERAVRNA